MVHFQYEMAVSDGLGCAGSGAAQELNQLIKMLPRGPLPMQWQPRDSPISSNSTEYLARTTSAPAFQILEIMPATAPRERLGVVPTRQRPWDAQTLLPPIFLRFPTKWTHTWKLPFAAYIGIKTITTGITTRPPSR
jgi:hypothetical protein